MPREERLLSDVLSDFARTMGTDFPIEGILDQLVQRIVEVLPVAAAGVRLIGRGTDPGYVAASDRSALDFERVQLELDEGPSLVAQETGTAVVVPDLRAQHDFPTFGPLAVDAGVVAVFTFPLRNGDAHLGVLDLYRDTPGLLDHATMTAAQTLADVAAAYLRNARARADLEDSSDLSRERLLHDPLTGLPNRILLLERLEHALLRGRRTDTVAAVLFANLEEFKLVNDTYSHRVGDELLVAVAERLRGQLRPADTLARLSGDEFAILCEDLLEAAEADAIAARIGAALAEPFVLSTGQIDTTASIGIALAEESDHLPEDLLHIAELAMYQAKRKGGGRHQIIDIGEQRLVDERASLQRDLRQACARNELLLEYQPIVGTVDRRIIGVEALVRWLHPSRGLVPPTTLVPLAEQSGTITAIGRWVLEQACRRGNTSAATRALPVSANVSAYQLMSPNFAATVEDVLLSTHIDPGLVTLEVTESVFLQDSQRALVVLQDLKHLGVTLALDDFGTGYSSLSYLKRFPVDIVKIDRGFVADLGKDHATRAIVSSVVDLAHALGLTVVAEGVETVRQHEEVEDLGCEACQGYYFARPMSADALNALMNRRVSDGNPRLPVDV